MESVSVSPHDWLPGLTINVFLLYDLYIYPSPSSLLYSLDTGPPIYSQLNRGVGRKEEHLYPGYLPPSLPTSDRYLWVWWGYWILPGRRMSMRPSRSVPRLAFTSLSSPETTRLPLKPHAGASDLHVQ